MENGQRFGVRLVHSRDVFGIICDYGHGEGGGVLRAAYHILKQKIHPFQAALPGCWLHFQMILACILTYFFSKIGAAFQARVRNLPRAQNLPLSSKSGVMTGKSV